jgi:hypothetical protein
MTETGFLLDPLMSSDPDLLAFFGHEGGNRVTSFWLTCQSPWCYRDRIDLTVTKCPKPASASYSREDLHRIAAIESVIQ